ncbi:MAG: MerR family transcriptional regulator [Desulfobacterales bacterium]|nr:MerR family transcriptional regulator [Desulfobacterales bacterium]
MARISDNKRYFRIGEASRIIGVEPYVLRYWESVFSQIRPQRAESKQRTYQRADLETLLEIKKLLHDEKMTIEGAKRRLSEAKAGKNTTALPLLRDIKENLQEVLKILT